MKKSLPPTITTLSLICFTILSAITLSSTTIFADDVVDQVNITIPSSCTMSGIISSGNEHTANINPNTYQANIGETTITTHCNDNGGYAIYAIGFTGDQYTDVWFYLKSVELNTDTGLLFRNIKTEEFISYDYHISNKDNREGSNFISLFIRIGQNKETYYRSYRKLQVVTAEVGGMINLLLVCGEFISYYFREILYKDFILGFCYDNNNNNNKTGNKVKEVVYSGKNAIGKFNVQQQQQQQQLQQQQVCKQNSFDITIPGVINNNNNNNSSNNGNNSSLLSIHTIGVKNCFNNNDSCCVKGRLNLHTWNNNNNSSCSGNGSKYNQQQLRKSQTFQFRRRFDKDLNTWQLVLIVCNGKVRKRIKNVNYKFQQIGLLFDVIQFLKLNEDVNMIQKYYCNEFWEDFLDAKTRE